MILPLLTLRDLPTLLQVIRLWSMVLAANLIGACMFAWVCANTNVFTPELRAIFAAIGAPMMSTEWSTLLIRGVFVGWLIAMLVWMMPTADSSRAAIIVVMTYLVALCQFPHVVAGSVEAVFLVASGTLSWGGFFGHFLAPTLIGKHCRRSSSVAFFNHAQVVSEDTTSARMTPTWERVQFSA